MLTSRYVRLLGWVLALGFVLAPARANADRALGEKLQRKYPAEFRTWLPLFRALQGTRVHLDTITKMYKNPHLRTQMLRQYLAAQRGYWRAKLNYRRWQVGWVQRNLERKPVAAVRRKALALRHDIRALQRKLLGAAGINRNRNRNRNRGPTGRPTLGPVIVSPRIRGPMINTRPGTGRRTGDIVHRASMSLIGAAGRPARPSTIVVRLPGLSLHGAAQRSGPTSTITVTIPALRLKGR